MMPIGTRPLAAGFALALLLAGCTPPPAPTQPASSPAQTPPPSVSSQPPSPPAPTQPPSPPSSQPPPPAASAPGNSGGIEHIVIIVQENKPSSQIMGSGDAAYFNKLADEYAVATNYQAIMHPSLPNYLALTSGTNAGITSNCKPKECRADVRSIADEVSESGRSWKMYAEGMPAPCSAENSGRYAVRHNPFMYYPSVTADKNSCAAHVVPLTQLDQDLASASSLPNYLFISPDLCNDTHDCPIRTGDEWLARLVPRILGSPAFTTRNSLLVVTWDEGSDGDNRVATVFAGPAARNGYTSDAAYTHYSLLHTIEEAWGLQPLTGNDRNAPSMAGLLK
ncbi:alkaline phosphatase family protein [Pseudarthrobacter sp. H2]|uniref:alkaline phosphatase family protein n=1 Tax=Pseudarthrobacter sp. H2 TaxID=3418415 RepID=UPI003CF87833